MQAKLQKKSKQRRKKYFMMESMGVGFSTDRPQEDLFDHIN